MTLRAGVIGLGVMGRHHTRVLQDMDGVDLVGVADPDPAALDKVLRGRDLRGFSDTDRCFLARRSTWW